ncbi:MAG TPA: M48 family metallopeptidase [Steroidobacteraceae bacterium]|nr:M48 family metallopeptidase [Steroidobacteraceae bacterium]
MHWLTPLFVVAVLAGVVVDLWLSQRQAAAVARHRAEVPAPFAESISADEHGKAADYTIAKVRFGRIGTVVDAALLLVLTVGGGIALVDALWRRTGLSEPWLGVVVLATIALIAQLLSLPFSIWRTFRLEARFGFNRTTPALFLADLGKSLALAVMLGGPLLIATLLLMERAGRWWWLWAFGLWLAVMFLMAWAWPAFIAPLFNRFTPLQDATLKARIEALLKRCGFASKGVFVVDNSRRSSHGNAYFTGIGRHKRIVFFDTLLEHLGHPEVEAVLAHELGHFRLKHVRKRLLLSVASMFLGLALLGWLTGQPGFYHALGVPVPSTHAALLLFVLVLPVFTFFVTPLASLWSRRHEFEADAFASQHANAGELATALVKLHRDNASTLTPDPVYAAFYYSHPPPLTRITRLRAAAAAAAGAAPLGFSPQGT